MSFPPNGHISLLLRSKQLQSHGQWEVESPLQAAPPPQTHRYHHLHSTSQTLCACPAARAPQTPCRDTKQDMEQDVPPSLISFLVSRSKTGVKPSQGEALPAVILRVSPRHSSPLQPETKVEAAARSPCGCFPALGEHAKAFTQPWHRRMVCIRACAGAGRETSCMSKCIQTQRGTFSPAHRVVEAD